MVLPGSWWTWCGKNWVPIGRRYGRVIGLNTEQWRRMRAAGRVPKRLAGAQCAGTIRLAAAVDWTTWLTGLSARR
jgi:hypothetical protein